MNMLDVVLAGLLVLALAGSAILLWDRQKHARAAQLADAEAKRLAESRAALDLVHARQTAELEGERLRLRESQDANRELVHCVDDLRADCEGARLKWSEAQARLAHLEQAQEAMRDAFRLTSTEVVREALDDLGKRQAELAKRTEAETTQREATVREKLAAQLRPIADTLDRFEKQVVAIERSRAEDQGGLRQQIDSLLKASNDTQAETRRLSGALRRGAGIQGRWGEQTLRNVLERAGLQTRFDFAEQVSVEQDGQRRRPDVTVRMPGGGVLVVDAKCSLTAFMEAQDAVDDVIRLAALGRHAASLKTHVQGLSTKEYWSQFEKSGSPDFVAMFVPGDGFLGAALDHAPNLLTEAMDKRVVIVTPTTLFALCKAVAYGWRVDEQARNSDEIAKLGKDLYARLSVMGKHVAQLGRHLDGAVGKYNEFVGSLESQVLSQARRFEDLKVDHEGRNLPDLQAIGLSTRALTKLAVIKTEAETLLAAPVSARA